MTTQVVDKDDKQQWPQDRALGNSTGDWFCVRDGLTITDEILFVEQVATKPLVFISFYSVRGRRQMNRLNSAKMNRLNFGYLAELAEFKKNI